MSKIYEGQTLQIDVVMERNITGAGTTQIKYRKPGGSTGAWTATVTDATIGWLTYKLAAASNDENSVWHVWGYVVLSGGEVLIGQMLDLLITEEGY